MPLPLFPPWTSSTLRIPFLLLLPNSLSKVRIPPRRGRPEHPAPSSSLIPSTRPPLLTQPPLQTRPSHAPDTFLPSLLPPSTPQAAPRPLLHPREAACTERPVHVCVSFSLNDLECTEQKMGSFSEKPIEFRKEFLRVTQMYDFTCMTSLGGTFTSSSHLPSWMTRGNASC